MAVLRELADSFSLFYQIGNLDDKTGICPEGSNLKWLNQFKSALSDTLDNTDRPTKLTVQGFASREPVAVNDSVVNATSNTLNLRIANERAEAIVYYLTTGDIDANTNEANACSDALTDSQIWRADNFDPHANTWKETGFDLEFKPWTNWDSMDVKKPSKSLTLGDNRQFDVEFLDRSIRITIDSNDNPRKSPRGAVTQAKPPPIRGESDSR